MRNDVRCILGEVDRYSYMLELCFLALGVLLSIPMSLGQESAKTYKKRNKQRLQ